MQKPPAPDILTADDPIAAFESAIPLLLDILPHYCGSSDLVRGILWSVYNGHPVSLNRLANLDRLKPTDEIKLVLADEADYRWAREQIVQHDLARRCGVLLSPVHGRLAARELAEWILRDRLPVRMQIQLHKILWGDAPGH